MGWGVLLWYIDDPEIPSGVLLPVQSRSNIEQAWITGIPEAYDTQDRQLAMVPLPHLEYFRSKAAAEKYAETFAEYAVIYAEVMQDGLPIRDKPENNARRTYRLRLGEYIKILEKVEGVDAISTTGTPLEGDWFKVLTESGSVGFCFSLRLRMFEHGTSPLGEAPVEADTSGDKDLELVLSRIWYPESYRTMINSGNLDLDALSKNYSFTSGISTGRARINLEKGSAEFPYRRITKTGDRSWNFDGTSLNVILRSETTLEVEWEDENKAKQKESFVILPVSVENIVNQEKERRQNKFQGLYNRGPRFVSPNYGTMTLNAAGDFRWGGIEALHGELLPDTVLGSGVLDLEYNLTGDMAERYTGAMALRFDRASGGRLTCVFIYTLDHQGLRLEFIPADLVSNRNVGRRSPSPFVIYFSTEH